MGATTTGTAGDNGSTSPPSENQTKTTETDAGEGGSTGLHLESQQLILGLLVTTATGSGRTSQIVLSLIEEALAFCVADKVGNLQLEWRVQILWMLWRMQRLWMIWRVHLVGVIWSVLLLGTLWSAYSKTKRELLLLNLQLQTKI